MSSILDGLAPIFRDTFGDDELARYSKRDGSWQGSLKTIFANPASLISTGDGPGAVARSTTFDFAEVDLPSGYGQGDTIDFHGRTWRVRDPLPDGHGMVTLHVEAG